LSIQSWLQTYWVGLKVRSGIQQQAKGSSCAEVIGQNHDFIWARGDIFTEFSDYKLFGATIIPILDDPPLYMI
jgi:hypothetical protein